MLDLHDHISVCLDRLVTKVVNVECPEINISCDADYMLSNMHSFSDEHCRTSILLVLLMRCSRGTICKNSILITSLRRFF